MNRETAKDNPAALELALALDARIAPLQDSDRGPCGGYIGGSGIPCFTSRSRPAFPIGCAMHGRLSLLPLSFTLHFTFYILHFALCTLHFALCTLHFALCILHFAFCILHFAFCILHFSSNSFPRQARFTFPQNG
jgi:hypothetical protein